MFKRLRFVFIILSIFFQATGAVFGKYAALSLSSSSLIGIITNVFYICSLGCMILQAIVWQQALIHYPLSFAYPFMSLVNFVVLGVSAILFHEGITIANVSGLFIIFMGITVLSHNRGDDRSCSSP